MIVSVFPELSEKFIINQVTGLIDAGVELDVYAAMEPLGSKRHYLYERYALRERTIYAGVPRAIAVRLIELPALLAGGLVRNPIATLRALRGGIYTTAARNLKTLYFLRAFSGRCYEVVHCHFGPNGLVGAFLKDCGIARRLVVTFHGSDITTYPRRHGEGVYRTLYDRADVATAGTKFTRARIIENGCSEEKIEILPVGIRMEEYPETPLSIRSPHSLLTVGRLVEMKGHRYALEAFALVRKRFPDAEYTIVGDGPECRSLMRRAEELGIRDAVHFLGVQRDTEVTALYGRSAVFVLPSITAADGAAEGQGLVLQEAQACCLPVVSTLVGGIPEGVRDGETGFLVSEKDPDALADRICRLFGDTDLRERMGRAGRSFVAATYDLPILTKKLSEIYCRG